MTKVLHNVPVMYSCTHRVLTHGDFVDEINSESPYIFIKVFLNDDKFEYWRATYSKSFNTMRDIQMVAKGIEMCGYKVERSDFVV